MEKSILDGKRILAVDDEPDVLEVLGDEILGAAPGCKYDKATTYQDALQMLETENYDLVILDIMGVRGFDLLNLALSRNYKVAMLTAHSLNPQALRRSIEKGARTYLPKDKLGEIVSFLEDIFEEPDFWTVWGRMMNRLEGYFNSQWGKNWQQESGKFWKDFDQKTSRKKL